MSRRSGTRPSTGTPLRAATTAPRGVRVRPCYRRTRARSTTRVETESIILSMVDGDLRKITAQTVYEAAKRGDSTARGRPRDGSLPGAGVNRSTFSIRIRWPSGGVTQAGDVFRPCAEVKRRGSPAVDACRIVLARPLSAGVVGASPRSKSEAGRAVGDGNNIRSRASASASWGASSGTHPRA
jgi:hypothetical protein